MYFKLQHLQKNLVYSGRDSNPPDLMSCLPLSDFYQILPIYYKIMKTKGKIANL